MLKVIGAGFGRTGTYSIRAALEDLGFYKCYHFAELNRNPSHIQYWEDGTAGKPVNWHELFAGYQAAMDWPTAAFYKEFVTYYPEAKFLLTVRDPERWYDSVMSTIQEITPGPKQRAFMYLIGGLIPKMRHFSRVFTMADKLVWQGIFEGKFTTDRQFAIDCFHRHLEEVQQTVPPERLLIYEVKQGWEPLCNFLDVPIPNKPFPRLNDRVAFKQWGRRNIST